MRPSLPVEIIHCAFQEEAPGGWNTSGLDPGKYSRDNCFSLLIIEHAMTGEKAEDYGI
jgi:hypothetical protein